jgi:hypothetical protein
MQEQYATKSACGWKHSKRVYAKKMYSHAWNIAFTKDEKMLQANAFHLFQACSEWVQGDLAIFTKPKMANKSNNPSDGVAPGS